MSKDPANLSEYYCAPASWGSGSGWVLIREKVRAVSGDSGWTTRPAGEFPEILAHRESGEQKWKKGIPSNRWITGRDIDYSRKEDITEEEAIAVILMTKL